MENHTITQKIPTQYAIQYFLTFWGFSFNVVALQSEYNRKKMEKFFNYDLQEIKKRAIYSIK